MSDGILMQNDNNTNIKVTITRGRRDGDRMVVGFTTTYVSSACRHQPCEFESRAWRGVLDATCDKSLSVICGFLRIAPPIKLTAMI
jgi:hypothetical protein